MSLHRAWSLVIVVVLIMLIGGGAVRLINGERETHTISYGMVERTGWFIGSVTSARKAELSFETEGRITSILTTASSSIEVGNVIAELSNAELKAAVAEAEADLAAERQLLSELQRGTRAEEISIEEAELAVARVTVVEKREDLLAAVTESYTAVTEALYRRADQFFSNPRGVSRLLIPEIGVSGLTDDRRSLQFVVDDWEDEVLLLTSESDLTTAALHAEENLGQVRSFLSKLSSAVNREAAGTTDTEKSDITEARTSVDSALSDLVTSRAAYEDAQASVVVAEGELSLARAGFTVEEIGKQQAVVDRANAAVQRASAQLEKTIVRAPFSGVVTLRDVDIGERVASGDSVASITADGFEVEGEVSELDVGGVEVGERATIALDAFPYDILTAQVIQIDEAETIINNVPAYGVTLMLDTTPEIPVRSGMTANITILIDRRERVLYIPIESLVTREGRTGHVVVVRGRRVEDREVTLGLEGSDGRVEVLSGLAEGEHIIKQPDR